MKVSLLVTCLGDVLRPQVGIATVRLLGRLGVEVDFPPAQTCCGQPMYNSGFADLARAQARHTIETFTGQQPVVVPSGSCAAMVKVEYPELLADDPAWHSRASDLAARTFELSDFLVNQLGVGDVGARFDGTVTFHFACHLRMMAQDNPDVQRPAEPAALQWAESLIRGVKGATYVPLARLEQCCGFGGSFSVRYPTISTAMVDDKVNCILATKADAVVSTDVGCLMNIAGRLRRLEKPVQVLHLAELLERQ